MLSIEFNIDLAVDTARKEGREEERLNLARKLLKRGDNVSSIMELTELSLKEIEQLQQELNSRK